MRPRTLLRTIGALALLALLAGVSGAASATGHEQGERWVRVAPPEAAMDDTFVTSQFPNTTYGEHGSLVVGTDPPAFALLRFDLRDAFPANATLRSAHLVLTPRSTQGNNNAITEQTIEVRNVVGAWTEATVNWTGRPEVAPTGFARLDAMPGTSGALNWTLTDIVRALYDQQRNSTQPHHGWAIVALPPPVTFGSGTPFTFYSSNLPAVQAHLRPHLALHFDLNAPRMQNLTVNGRADGTFAPGVPALFQVETQDTRGHVASVKVQLKDELGALLHEFPLAATERVNLTRLPDGRIVGDPVNPYRYWSANFTLPESALARYRVDVEVRDNDGNIVNATLARRWTARLDAVTPEVSGIQVTPDTLRVDENGLFNLTARLADNEGVEQGAVVLYHLPTNQTLEFPMAPLNLRRYVNNTYSAEFRLADPGAWLTSVRVTDRSNLVTYATPFHLHVSDVSPPAIGRPLVGNPRGEGSDEPGVPVTFSVFATDASPLKVHLVLRGPFGTRDLHELEPVGNDTFALTLPLEDPGLWQATFIATDEGGLTRETPEPVTYRVEPHAPPRFELLLGPRGDAWGNATPRIVVAVYDRNLDADSIRAELYVDGVLQSGTRFTLAPTQGGVLATFDPTLSGRDVVLALRANDTLGNRADPAVTFSWRTDRVPPATSYDLTPVVTLQGDTHRVSPHTRFTLTAQDADSGTTATRWRLLGDAPGTSRLYRGPFTLPAGLTGSVQLQFWSEDAAGNSEERHTIRLDVVAAAPAVQAALESGALVGSATPAAPGVDVRALTVLTRTATEPWAPLAATVQVDPATGVWNFRAVPPSRASSERVEYAVHVKDALGNENFPLASPQALDGYTSGNHAPTAGFTAPVAGSRVAGITPVGWSAHDVDGGSLQVTLVARGTRLAETFTLTTLGGALGTVDWDTTTVPNGAYELLLTVRDAQGATTEARRIVHVHNPNGAVVPLGDLRITGTAGEAFTVKARVNQEARAVTLVLRGPEEVRVTLRDDGHSGDGRENDGVYGATVTLKQGGTYEGTFELQGADGQVLQGGKVLTVSASDAGFLTPGAGVLALLAALGAAAAAMRRRK